MRILFIGDVVGKPGRRALRELLPVLRNEYQADFIIANTENAAGGAGLTEKVAREIKNYGVDVQTGGNHTWDKREILNFIDNYPWILRPSNYPEGVPGRGFGVFTANTGVKVAVINLMGRVFMGNIDCPFRKADEILEKLDVTVKIVDFHAETTSEKQAMGYYLDGRVSAVIGTHTHVQTADERILRGGTAYITDVGMTGGLEGVIGVKKELALERFLKAIPNRFEPSKERIGLEAVFIEIDLKTGLALRIKRIRRLIHEGDTL